VQTRRCCGCPGPGCGAAAVRKDAFRFRRVTGRQPSHLPGPVQILHFVHVQLQSQGITAMCPPLGAVAVILFAAPGIPAAKPYNTALGSLAGSAAAYGIYTALGCPSQARPSKQRPARRPAAQWVR
jgi:hypothetical protein